MNKLNTVLAAILISAATASYATPNGNNGNNCTRCADTANITQWSNSTVGGIAGALGGGRAYTVQATESMTVSKFTTNGFKSQTFNIGEGVAQARGPALSGGGFLSNVGNLSNAKLINTYSPR